MMTTASRCPSQPCRPRRGIGSRSWWCSCGSASPRSAARSRISAISATEFVEHRNWLDEKSYADLVALCQFLPGPASSKVGLAIGLLRAGYPGALAAWLGFTLPSAIALVAVRLWGRRARRRARQRLAARPQGRGGRGGGAGGARHDAHAGARPRARDARRCGGGDRARRSDAPGARSSRSWWAAWSGCHAAAQQRAGGSRLAAAQGEPHRRCRAARIFFVLLIGLPLLAAAIPDQSVRAVRGVLSRGLAGVRRRSRGAAAAAVVGGSARLGDATTRFSPATAPRRPCPGRCSPSRPIWAPSWARRRTAGIGATLCLVAIFVPAFLLVDRPAAVLGRVAAARRRRKLRCAASMRRSSASAGARSTIRSGPRASPSAADFALARARVPAAVHVAGAALDRGGAERARRRADRRAAGRGVTAAAIKLLWSARTSPRESLGARPTARNDGSPCPQSSSAIPASTRRYPTTSGRR